MNNLIQQILKFGIVGVISTIVDFFVYTLCCNVIGIPYLIAGLCGFSISLIVNYILSMRYVFVRRDDISRKREFIIFAVMSLIGLGLNELILYICIDVIYLHSALMMEIITKPVMNVAAKVIATGIVMIYNFVSRKIVLERR